MLPIIKILAFYFIFVFLLSRWSKKQFAGLSVKEIAFAYGIKVLLGIFYGYIFFTWYNGGDTWYFHNGSIEEYEKLLKNPVQFFADFNPLPAFERNASFAKGWYYYLSDLEFWLLSKPMALFNFFSGGNYYINVVFFDFIVCWGHLWLFQLYVQEFQHQRKTLLITIFLIPSIVFWLSGIIGDGLIFFFLSLLLLHFYKLVNGGEKRSWIYIILGLAGITIFRSVLLLLLLPALLSWWITVRFNARIFVTTGIVYGSCILLFFGSLLLSADKNLPSFVANRQQEYFKLRGNTRFNLDTLQPTLQSFVTVLPQSVNNTLLRPYAWEARGIFQWAAAIETLLFIVLVVFFALKKNPKRKGYFKNPLILFPFLFAISLYIFIGYVVPFPGAIVRYKIPAELLLILVFVCGINWKEAFKFK